MPKTSKSKSKEDTPASVGDLTKKRGRGRPPKGGSSLRADGEKSKKKGPSKWEKKGINYAMPVHRVLKQVHPDLKIGKNAMTVRERVLRFIQTADLNTFFDTSSGHAQHVRGHVREDRGRGL